MKMTTEEAFVKVLQMHGIEHAFGIIGSAMMPVSDLFPKAGITFWDVAHETNGGLMCDGFILNSSSLGSPGLDSLKWLKPVLVGDELRARMTVLATRPMNSKPKVGLVQTRWEALNQRDEVVMTIESWAMFGRRHPGHPTQL